MVSSNQPILFFDGVCNLCNGTVDYVIRNDRSGSILFAPLQSASASKYLNDHDKDPNDLDTIILLKDGKIYTKAAAGVQIMQLMGGWLKIPAFIGRLTPTFLANAIYTLIARNRYRWFGKEETCRIPTADEAARFLD